MFLQALLITNIFHLYAENDVNFVIHFKYRTTENIPTLKSVTFPNTEELSVCTWFLLNVIPQDKDDEQFIFHYSSPHFKTENGFAMSVVPNGITSYRNDVQYLFTGELDFTLSKWTHVCWVWQVTGDIKFFYNGKLHMARQIKSSSYTQAFPKCSGTLILGQDRDGDKINDPDQMFRGNLAGFYIYNSTLDADDVRNIFNNKLPQNDVIVGWWQFRNKASGDNIVEETGSFCLNDHQCPSNAKCILTNNNHICICNNGFMDNGFNVCKDINFVINFKRRTIKNIPTLYNISMPECSQLSVCSWYKLSVLPATSLQALFYFFTRSYHSPDDKPFMMWFNQDYIQSVLRGYEDDVSGKLKFAPHIWNHICWTWNNQGKSRFYYNGKIYKEKLPGYRFPLPGSNGKLILGQVINGTVNDRENMFEGRIKGLYVYTRELKAYEVSRLFYGQPSGGDLLVGWWQFKGTTSGDDIVEETGLANRTSACIIGWVRFRNACYFFSQSRLTWLQAEYDCNRYDAHLASISDDEENTFIKNNVPANNYWIGLYDKITENIFQWTDETSFNYSRWSKNEPNDDRKGEDCVVFIKGYWNDFSCDNSNPYHICKQSLAKSKRKSEPVIPGEVIINSTCPASWKRHDHSCYLFSGLFGNTILKKKWIDAKYYCNYIGGDLVSILNENENNFIRRILKSVFENVLKIWPFDSTTGYWIGLHDNIFEDKFVWTDKTNSTFRRWQYKEPSNDNNEEHCVEFYKDAWNDLPCSDSRPFVCKLNLEDITHITSDHLVWKSNAGNKYLFSNLFANKVKQLSWNAAEIYCQHFDGHLASILSQSESEFLYQVYLENIGNETTEYWIGLNDVYNENDFIWTDRSSSNYTHWADTEPTDSNGNEDCVIFSPKGDWNDLPCSGLKNFICKSSTNDQKMNNRSTNSDKLLYILLPISIIIICIICLAGVIYRKRKFKNRNKGRLANQPSTEMAHKSRKFFELENIMSSDEWEIKHRSIKITKEIGAGSFGKVYCASLDSSNFKKSPYVNHTIKEPAHTQFAVKYLKEFAKEEEVHSFQAEINLMKRIGHHQNIINLVGCCTVKEPLCLVLEYMPYGDLLQYLRLSRTKGPTVEDGVRYSIPKESNIEVSSQDLLSFAWQIACGMEYLSGQNFVHRDLAARNVLVGSDKNVKIADFGLSRFLDNDMIYTTKASRRLPIKWMAIESIYDNEFTVSSDRWAYGIVLFEIFTIGGTPYPSITNSELIRRLKGGYRLEKADNISDELYEIMRSCWHEDPKQRPTFESLRQSFEKIISDTAEYVTLSIKENADYYLKPSFLTIEEEDDSDDDENMDLSVMASKIVSMS